MKDLATIEDFLKLDVRVGEIIGAEASPAQKPSYRLEIDFGPEVGQRVSSAAVQEFYGADELLGRKVVAIVNLAPRQVATVMSQVLCLGAVSSDGRVRLLLPESDAHVGDRIA